MRRVLSVLAVFVFVSASVVTAQEAASANPPWLVMVTSLSQGARVTVHLNEGTSLEGSIIERAADSLTLRPKGSVAPAQTVVAFSDIASVERGWKAKVPGPWSAGKKIAVFSAVGAAAILGAIVVTYVALGPQY